MCARSSAACAASAFEQMNTLAPQSPTMYAASPAVSRLLMAV